MCRGVILGALVAGGACSHASGTASTQNAPGGGQPAPSASAIEAVKLRENLYLLRGGGRTVQIGGVDVPNAGNSLAFITASGVVLVDTKVPGWGKPVIDKLKEITDKPVTTIINTHTHMDHVSGNVEFPAGVQIVAQENTAKLMAEMRPVSGGPKQRNLFKENEGRGLPTRTFKDRMTIGSGDDRVELYWFGPAHTGGDTWVVFPSASVVHAGDVFGYKAVPPLDVNNGASGVEYPRTLARALAALTDVDVVITGHYPTPLTLADLKTYGDFVGEFVRAVQDAKRGGRTVDDFVSAWKIPDRFLADGYVSVEHLRPIRADVEAIWQETR